MKIRMHRCMTGGVAGGRNKKKLPSLAKEGSFDDLLSVMKIEASHHFHLRW
jgi:hypothetical protein